MATQQILFDSLLPNEMAIKAEDIGVKKAKLGTISIIVLGGLAGFFIALGAIFATTVAAGTSGSMPYGVVRLLAGLVFSLGLILVIVAGAELFTGNNLIIMAWASRRVTTRQLLRNWVLVYIANFLGSISTALLLYFSGQYKNGAGAVGEVALATANAKVQLGFVEALALGIFCNALVCLAIWLTLSARTTTDKIIAIIPPITAFVAAGFEHSVANMYFIPIGLFIKAGAPDSFWAMIGKTAADFPALTWGNFVNNLVPVTIGNVIGGALMVGGVYWAMYLRKRDSRVEA